MNLLELLRADQGVFLKQKQLLRDPVKAGITIPVPLYEALLDVVIIYETWLEQRPEETPVLRQEIATARGDLYKSLQENMGEL